MDKTRMNKHDYVLIKLYWHKQARSQIWPLSYRLSTPELDEQAVNISKPEKSWGKNKPLEFWKLESGNLNKNYSRK